MPVTAEEAKRLLEVVKEGSSLEQLQGLLNSLNLDFAASSSSSGPAAAAAAAADADADPKDKAAESFPASAQQQGPNSSSSGTSQQQQQPSSSSSGDAAAAGRAHLGRVDGDSRLLIQRAEPDASPLVSATSCKVVLLLLPFLLLLFVWLLRRVLRRDLRLSKELLMGVESLGFLAPSKIQAAALPLVLNHQENLIAQAQNGSGKTATFALSMLSCANAEMHQPQALCLCPTRELAHQTVLVLKSLARFTRLRIFLAVPQSKPGLSEFNEEPQAEEGDIFALNAEGQEVVFTSNTSPDVRQQIVVGTPGKSMELLKKRRFNASFVRMLVLDEADELINFANNMAPQVQQIRRCLPGKLQILLFSATYSDSVRQFAEKLIPRANKITLKREELTLACIQQFYMIADPSAPLPPSSPGPRGGPSAADLLDLEAPAYLMLPHHLQRSGAPVNKDTLVNMFKQKFAHLKTLYSALAVGQSVIFVNSRRLAFFLALKLQKELSFSVSLICGSQAQGPEKLSIEIRDKIMREFRRGETKVLICTDVLARGIDVPQVTLVVNFDLPIYYSGRAAGAAAAAAVAAAAAGHSADESWVGGEDEGENRAAGGPPPGHDCSRGVCINFETYLHRIGRTGRFGLKGIAVNLVCPEELFLLDQIRAFYKCQIDELNSDPEEIENIIRRLRTA
ncbi:hypothetical protein Esti_002714 [Eimeria stiedai]